MNRNVQHVTRGLGSEWFTLYEAALFEDDRARIAQRIAEAEKAILARIRELFVVTGDHIEEDQVLDDALYGLRALRSCVVSEAPVKLRSEPDDWHDRDSGNSIGIRTARLPHPRPEV